MNSPKKDWIIIEDDFKGYDPEMFTIPELYKDSIDSILITKGMVSDRLEKVALQVGWLVGWLVVVVVVVVVVVT